MRGLSVEKFTPTHKIIDGERVILVQELVGDNEFFDEEEFISWGQNPVGIGNYGLDELQDDLLLTRTTAQDPEFGEIVAWDKAPHLKLVRICIDCHSDRLVRAVQNGKNTYLCQDCGATMRA